MVEIDMTLGELPSTKMEEIKIADQKRVTPFLRRRKYKLFSAFFSATCVYPNDAPVEFEVSIGETGLPWQLMDFWQVISSCCCSSI
jgi:dysferlin